MGLHICYDLRLPGDTTDEDAVRLLEGLRVHALTLGVASTTPVSRLTGGDVSLDHDRWERWSVPWLLHVVSRGIREERDGAALPMDEPDRLAVAGFLMHPGEGSEAAAFGVVRPCLAEPPANAERTDEWQNWFWHSCCKTQYASTVSDEHLLHCHRSVVRMLEEAQRIGFGVTVRDETHYWETRSTERLLLEVRNMNRVVARIAGAFHDAVSPQQRVEGAIFEHPDFERLETERPETERPETERLDRGTDGDPIRPQGAR